MSQLANQEREVKQRWAVPGSSHDRVVRFAKVALPSAVGVVIAFLAMAPLEKSGDVSFILDKNQVENAPERMRVEQARYTGEDNRGQTFEITANRAPLATTSRSALSTSPTISTARSMSAAMSVIAGWVAMPSTTGRFGLTG